MARSSIVVSWTLAALVAATAAQAHRFEHPKKLRVGFGPERMLISVTYDVNPGNEARNTRVVFDRNADGGIDSAEATTILDYLEKMVRLWLRVSVDGRNAELERVERIPSRIEGPATDSSNFGAAFLFSVPLPGGSPIRVELRDRGKDPTEHVPAVADLDPAWFVDFASQGEFDPARRQLARVRLDEARPLKLVLVKRGVQAAP